MPLKLEIPCAENSNLLIFPRMGAFDHLKWTYDEAFKQLFGPGREKFEQKFSENSNARGVAREGYINHACTTVPAVVASYVQVIVSAKLKQPKTTQNLQIG